MGAIDVGIHGGETIGKAFGHEALRGQVVTLVEIVAADHMKDTGITLQARGMQRDSIEQVVDALGASLRDFQRHATNQSMNFVPQTKQMFRQVTTVLTRDSCYQNFLSSLPSDRKIFQIEHVHPRFHKAIDSMARRANNGLIFVERRIKNYRHSG